MVAIDTDVVVRLIVGDDEHQVELALALAAREQLFVSLTVLLETEWVLRSRYAYDRAQASSALRNLRLLGAIVLEADADVVWAIERYGRSGELADFIHIAAARAAGSFASFETKLPRRAGGRSPVPVRTLR